MDTMAEIRNQLLAGKSADELIRKGFAKSTVYAVQRKLQSRQVAALGAGVDDELVQLRRDRDRAKLMLEIQEIESKRERLPQRMDSLEKEVQELRAAQHHTIRMGIYSLLRLRQGWDDKEADEQSEKYTNEFLALLRGES